MTTTDGQAAHQKRPLRNRPRLFASLPEGEELPLRVWTDDGGVVWLTGALECDTVPAVRAVLRASDPAGCTILDASGLHFIDSSGLGCLLAQDDRARRAGGRFVVRRPGPRLMRVFEVTGALDRLTIEPALA